MALKQLVNIFSTNIFLSFSYVAGVRNRGFPYGLWIMDYAKTEAHLIILSLIIL
jgi:hypothetical protein